MEMKVTSKNMEKSVKNCYNYIIGTAITVGG